jgi:alkanesulfonate monooxygenase SsuD/methylene tetrahydromethanopterin reductase-like flavin-dependent oxidoreductase (luciferase family)
MTSAERYRANLDQIARYAREASRASVRFGTAAFQFTALDASLEAAHRRAAGLLGRLYARPFEDAARKYCLLGPAADCLEQMRRFAAAGVRQFILAPLGDPDEFAERVAEEILPEVPGLRG